MRLDQHPEYKATYFAHHRHDQVCRSAIAQWQTSDETLYVPAYDWTWTFSAAQNFVKDLSALLLRYNRMIWEDFSYCRNCGGQCCMVGASTVTTFDFMALALLNENLPVLPDHIQANVHDCIYRTAQGCAWQGSWRTLKCWLFYCLSGNYGDLESLRAQYRLIARQLKPDFEAALPEILRRYEHKQQMRFVAYLEDPLGLNDVLRQALDQVLVEPFNKHFDVFETMPTASEANNQKGTAIPLLEPDILAFMAEVASLLSDEAPNSTLDELTQQHLQDDLDLLEWVIWGQPQRTPQLLDEMLRRYQRPSESEFGAEIRQKMAFHLQRLRQAWAD